MDAEAGHASRLVQVGFMRRFDADYRRLKAVIDGGTLGAPLLYHSVHRNASVPEGLYTSEMLLNDTLVHDADVTRWLLGDEIAGVEVRVPRRSSHGKDLRDPVVVLQSPSTGASASSRPTTRSSASGSSPRVRAAPPAPALGTATPRRWSPTPPCVQSTAMERIAMRDKPDLYGQPVAVAA